MLHLSIRGLATVTFAATLAVVPLSLSSSAANGQPAQTLTSSASAAGSVLFRDYFNHKPNESWTFYNRYSHYRFGHLLVNGGYMDGSGGCRANPEDR